MCHPTQHSQIVWGGDPTTDWGFDGLDSAIKNGLTMGLSGVSMWGSDIGGFFALSAPQTTAELLNRWIEMGFASGVMRLQANGFGLPGDPRPGRAQIFDADVLPIWARYAKLRTQLYPYLAAAESEYDQTGMPLMRHLALVYPDDPIAIGREDEYMLGGDLLVAPVTQPGVSQKTLYLPDGRWIDWWRSVSLDSQGAPHLGAAELLSGAGDTTLPAPLDELPLLAREGAVIPLLDPSVETLADYGRGTAVRLRDRERQKRLLAWPSGDRTVALGPAEVSGDQEVAISEEAGNTWTLDIRGRRTRSYQIEAWVGFLRNGAFRPCNIRAPGSLTPPRWSYDQGTGVLDVRVRGRRVRVLVRSC